MEAGGSGNPERVSCIVPVYNGSRFLLQALRSIAAQTWPHTEVIVIDDGSTDATPSLAEAAGPGVRWIRQENQGPASARNTGLGHATGSFVAFLDADDLWVPDKLERQLARFRERPELMICLAGMRNVRGTDADSDDPLLDPSAWPAISFSPCTMLARRSGFDLVGPFNPDLRHGEDTEWFVRMMMRKIPYEVMPDVLLERRIHETNLSREQIPSP
ncbi:MAG TPA: glycosyltransferase family A protein, partial [Gemmatimonadales bacterium]